MRSLGQGGHPPQGQVRKEPRVERRAAPQGQGAQGQGAQGQGAQGQGQQHHHSQPQSHHGAHHGAHHGVPHAPQVGHGAGHGAHPDGWDDANRTQEGRALFSGGIARQGMSATRPEAAPAKPGKAANRSAAKLAAKHAAKHAAKAAKRAKAVSGKAPRLIRGHGQPKRDPAPSRLTYKFHRLWLTPLYRSLLRVGVPVFLVISMTGWYFSNPTNRFAIAERVEGMRRAVETRPEFMVKLMAVEGASPVLDTAVREMIPVNFPISSFDLDLDAMQAEVAKLDVVEDVALRIRPGGVLEVAVTERQPVLVWRAPAGIELIDATGHRVASLTGRSARPDLPLVAGEGADAEVREALSLLATAKPLADRLRGLVRVGARRWDVVLEDGGTIMLPEENPVGALDQVLAIDQAQDLLARDLTHIDMRNPRRPTLRMAAPAVEELRRIRTLSSGVETE